MNTTDTSPIFVVSCPRSGSSLFARMLVKQGLRTPKDHRSDPKYPAGYYEHFPSLLWVQALERLPRGSHNRITVDPFITSDDLEDPYLAETFRMAFKPILEREVDFIKLPRLALAIDFILEQFPGAHIIALWREVTPTFKSLQQKELPWSGFPASLIRANLMWSTHAHAIVEAKRKHPDAVSVYSIDEVVNNNLGVDPLLKRLGYDIGDTVRIGDVIDRSIWTTRAPLGWQLLHLVTRMLTSLAAFRMAPKNRVLANQRRIQRALESVSEHG